MRIVDHHAQAFELIGWNDFRSAMPCLTFGDRSSARSFLGGFCRAPDNLAAMRLFLLGDRRETGLSRLEDWQILDRLSHYLWSGEIAIRAVTREYTVADRSGGGSSAGSAPPAGRTAEPTRPAPQARQAGPTDAITAGSRPAAAAAAATTAFELAFVLEEADSGLLLPHHRFHVVDADGNEIASGETDANGLARILVDRAADFEVVPASMATHRLAGCALVRGSLEPAAGLQVELADDEGRRFATTSDAEGRFAFDAVLEGAWILRAGDTEHPLHLDARTGPVTLTVQTADGPTDETGDWHDALDVPSQPEEDLPPFDIEEY